MNEQFDRTLRNHIRDTFDHYDDLMADDGWNKFNKQKNRKKRGLIFWYAIPSGIAAALALLWIFSITTNEVIKTKNDELAQTHKTAPAPKIANSEKSTEDGGVSAQEVKRQLVKKTKTDREELRTFKNNDIYAGASAIKNRVQVELIQTNPIKFDGFKPEYTPAKIYLAESVFARQTPKAITNEEFLAFNNELLNNTTTAVNPNTKANKKPDQKKKDNNFNFSVDANTYYSFTSAGISNDLDVGIGFLSAVKLTNRLSINSGISLNQQSAIYQNSQQSSNSQSFDTASSPNSLISSVGKQSFSVPEGVTTNARLVGFDIPLNLKYDINLGKAKTFITTGVSSYSLLNQSYTNDVSVVNYSLTSSPTTSVLRNVEKERDGAFSNFQFARTLNFSFGVLYPVSTKNSISVEPFVKYPISGFGNRDLEIGSGGVSFKLNFGR